MCISCYKEYGSPLVISDLTRKCAELVAELYEFSFVGGNCHIVTDDWNLEDEHIQWCLKSVLDNKYEDTPEQLAVEKKLLELLASMSIEERASSLAIHDGFIG
jgi:hypothetical protein